MEQETQHGDAVVRALLTAVATLEDLAAAGADAHWALSTLEGISDELGAMASVERREFLAALERLAGQDPDRADWIRGLPEALGVTG